MLSLEAWALDKPQGEVKVERKLENYNIRGRNSAELRAAMNAKGPLNKKLDKRFDARTDWSIDWTYKWDKSLAEKGVYRLSQWTIQLKVKVILPRWENTNDGLPFEQRQWQVYQARLQLHEAGHYGKRFGRPKLLDDSKKTSTDPLEQRLFVANAGSSHVQRFRNPRGLSRTDHTGNISPGNIKPDNTTPSTNAGRTTSESENSKAGGWFGENEFGRAGPNGIAIDSQRNVYAADAGSNRVQKFSSSGVFITQWGGKGSRPGEFYYGKDHGGPMGIATAGKRVFVTDQGNFRVQVFTQDGIYSSEFGTEGTGDGQFLKPTHVAVDSKGHVYVTDWERRDVQKFVSSASGYEWALTFGGKETVAHEQGLFYAKADGYGPNGIAVNSKDLIHVSDSGNCRVQVFDSGGVFQHQIPAAHYTPANF